jgi:hypothetical protein
MPPPVAGLDRPPGSGSVLFPVAVGAGGGVLLTVLLFAGLWFAGVGGESGRRLAKENDDLQYTRSSLEHDNEELKKLTRELQRARDEAEAQRKEKERALQDAQQQLAGLRQKAERGQREVLAARARAWELKDAVEKLEQDKKALAERLRELEAAGRMDPEKKDPVTPKMKPAEGSDKGSGRPAEPPPRKVPENLALPALKDRMASWNLEDFGVVPSKDNQLALPDVAQDGANEEITCPTPKGRRLTVSLGGGGPISRLATFELQGSKLEFSWIGRDAAAAKLLHDHKLLILGADGTRRTLVLKVP